MRFILIYSVLNTISEYTYFYISKNITSYNLFCFENRRKPSVYLLRKMLENLSLISCIMLRKLRLRWKKRFSCDKTWCSSDLAQLVSYPYSRGRSTRYSDRLDIFLSPFLDVTRMSMSTVSFLGQLDSGILCLQNAFPWPMI